ncbi:presenilin-like protein [Tripterygium wilfordii]|uniref:Presenilin n=1 Tax=Tripterygium wilfordii TaxID=458696 RepID=A0A7J7C7V9_TRIWF|nr:presenilin-like protein At2g29900 [Tripterygium wilfordii]KAF5730190.1 presenilin-like protein [Tripterygium wilfordii]
MAQNQRSKSIIDSLGEEIIRIIAPVSICMFMVVLMVCVLNTDSSDSASSSVPTIATIAYAETGNDSWWDKLKGALLNSLVFVAVITLATFLMVLLFYFRCTRFLKFYMGFSAFTVLGFMGGEILLFLLEDFRIPIDCITFLVVLFNFAAVGVLAVFMSKMAIFVTQSYLVVIGVLVAYWFTLLPEWTTWVLLVALALYDLAAVLLPVGPLRLLVELAISRDEEIPALVFEARPVVIEDSGPGGPATQRRVWRERRNIGNSSGNASIGSNSTTNVATFPAPGSNFAPGSVLSVSSDNNNNTRLISTEDTELSAPLIDHRITLQSNGLEDALSSESWSLERIGLGSAGAIKLGLGDFIFYSVLVGRAAMYDLMTVYACYLAIIAGLGVTLLLLALYEKALPALPVSIALGVLFYFLTRLVLEVFVVQCSLNLLMF